MKNQKIATSRYLELDKDSRKVIKDLNLLLEKIQNKEFNIYEYNKYTRGKTALTSDYLIAPKYSGDKYNTIQIIYKENDKT